MNFSKVQKRRGIGNVITTLIILIASVVLGAGVIFFGGSMFQTNTQSESIKVSNVYSWVNSAGDATTAFVVQNTGSKAVTINSVNLRGLQVPTSSWWSSTNATTTELQTALPVAYNVSGASPPAGITGPFTSGPISLSQGDAAVVYMNDAGSMTTLDAGNTYSLQIQAGQATAVQQVQVITA
jgi:hypothetical protein